MNQLIDWLNQQPDTSLPMQRDGNYALMTWKDLRRCAEGREIGFQQIVWMALLVVGIPLVMVG